MEKVSDRIIRKWEDLWGNIDYSINISDFFEAYLDTWNFFIQTLKDDSFGKEQVEILILLSKFTGYQQQYPIEMNSWDYDAVLRFIEGFLHSVLVRDLGYGRTFENGYISVKMYINQDIVFHIDQFKEMFDDFCSSYRSRVCDE